MKYKDKNIADLSDDELRDAIRSCGDMDGFRFDKLANPLKRHVKIFAKHPPTENPAFTELTIALNTEFKNRKLANA